MNRDRLAVPECAEPLLRCLCAISEFESQYESHLKFVESLCCVTKAKIVSELNQCAGSILPDAFLESTEAGTSAIIDAYTASVEFINNLRSVDYPECRRRGTLAAHLSSMLKSHRGRILDAEKSLIDFANGIPRSAMSQNPSYPNTDRYLRDLSAWLTLAYQMHASSLYDVQPQISSRLSPSQEAALEKRSRLALGEMRSTGSGAVTEIVEQLGHFQAGRQKVIEAIDSATETGLYEGEHSDIVCFLVAIRSCWNELQGLRELIGDSSHNIKNDATGEHGASEADGGEAPPRKLRRCEYLAYLSFRYAVGKTAEWTEGKVQTVRDAFEYLSVHGFDPNDSDSYEYSFLADYDLPSFDTYKTQVSKGRNAHGDPKNNSRNGRTSRSIAKQSQIEPAKGASKKVDRS